MDCALCMPWDVRSSRSVPTGAGLRPGSDRFIFWCNEALVRMWLERSGLKKEKT